MTLAAPTNTGATYEQLARDQFAVSLWWEPVPGAAYYKIYRDTDVLQVDPPYTYKTVEGKQFIVYRDVEAWFAGQSLDLFYWFSAVENVTGSDGTVTPTEGTISDALTNLHPFGLRIVEEARSIIGDDLRIFNDANSTIKEQISIYNYKIAMDQALNTINSTPTFSTFTYGSVPHQLKSLLTIGTLVYVLPKLILLEKAKAMKFADQGQEWTPPELVDALEKNLTEWRKEFNENRREIKHNMRPAPMAVGSLRALFISPQMLKWRHVPSGRNFFGFLFGAGLSLHFVLDFLMKGINILSSLGGSGIC